MEGVTNARTRLLEGFQETPPLKRAKIEAATVRLEIELLEKAKDCSIWNMEPVEDTHKLRLLAYR